MQKLMVLLEVSEAGCPSSSSASAVRTRGGCASKLYHPHHFALTFSTPNYLLMSHVQSNSSSNFQLIFNNALKAYEKRTKNDLLAHPLAAQLQACDSPTAILALLHRQVQELNQARNSDERLSKWLDPTVNVLYAFSAILGEGVGLV